ncbi:MAG: copper ion binding protein, partial [Silicimonas sp.]|nr:copper ion binding protein [Silicimonas sp.]
MTHTFRTKIEGMSCASCVRRVETALTDVAGVTAARANLATGSIEADLDGATPANVIEALSDAGYPAATETRRYTVEGLSCASCVGRLESALADVPGVTKVAVNLTDHSARIEVVTDTSQARLLDAARKAGYPISPVDDALRTSHDHRDEAISDLKRDTIIAAALVFPVFLLEMGGHVIPGLHGWIG